MSLATFYPKPQILRVAGVDVVAREWRVGHAASIDRWLADRPHPLADLDPASATYAERLRVAFGSDWPPRLGDDDARIPEPGVVLGNHLFFGTEEGQSRFLRITLRASDSSILGILPGIAESLTPADWRSLKRVAFGEAGDVRADAGRLIDEHLGIGPYEPCEPDIATVALISRHLPKSSKDRVEWPRDWSSMVAMACTEFGFTPSQVRRLYLGQLRMMRSASEKPRKWTFPTAADLTLGRELEAKRCEFLSGGNVAAP